MKSLAQEIFQHYEVFTDTAFHGCHETALVGLPGGIPGHIHAETRPKSVELRLGTMYTYTNNLGFIIYNKSVTLFRHCVGYIFITIPGTESVYYAAFKLKT